jgi:hypothetical protein
MGAAWERYGMRESALMELKGEVEETKMFTAFSELCGTLKCSYMCTQSATTNFYFIMSNVGKTFSA